jgi:hypothetical protein
MFYTWIFVNYYQSVGDIIISYTLKYSFVIHIMHLVILLFPVGLSCQAALLGGTEVVLFLT